MLLIVGICLMVVIFTLFLHCTQHFRFNLSSDIASTTIAPAAMELVQNTKYINERCSCRLTSIDGQEYDFIPSSFCYYMLFVTFLCMVLFTKYLINPSDILDYILIYGIMLLSIWESLFSFCRYYTTRIATKTLRLVSTTYCVKRFVVYAMVFTLFWCFETHTDYRIFPAILMLHYTFNVYCISCHAHMLIKRYKPFLDQNGNNDITRSIYLMKKVSICSNIISTAYLTIFLCTNDINITYYLCILWAVSCFIFSLNFVRNRNYISYKIFQFSQYIRCCKKHEIEKKRNCVKQKVHIKIDANPEEESKQQKQQNYDKVRPPTRISKSDQTTEINEDKNPKNNCPKAFDVLGLTPSHSNMYYNDSYKYATNNTANNKSNIKEKTHSKDSKSKSSTKLSIKSKSEDGIRINYISMNEESPDDEDEDNKYNQTITPQVSDIIIHIQPQTQQSTTLSAEKVALSLYSSASANNVVKQEEIKGKNGINHILKLKDSASVPDAPKSHTRKHFHLKVPDKLELNLKNTTSDDNGFVYNGENDINYDVKSSEWNNKINIKSKINLHRKNSFSMNNYHNNNLKVQKRPKMHSMNSIIGLNDQQLEDDTESNLDEVMLSMMVLAKHGFCTRKSINSVHQIKLHQIKLHRERSQLKLSQQFEEKTAKSNSSQLQVIFAE